jgi:outer membrane receptor protein involved in Fe transport
LPYLNNTTLSGLTPGFGYASFLLGDVKTISISNPVTPRLGKHELGFFGQDSWKVTRKLTIDYGARYDFSHISRGARMGSSSTSRLGVGCGRIAGFTSIPMNTLGFTRPGLA